MLTNNNPTATTTNMELSAAAPKVRENKSKKPISDAVKMSGAQLAELYKKHAEELGMKPSSTLLRFLNDPTADLTTISLAKNYFGDRGFAAIFPTLRHAPMMVLDLHDTLLNFDSVSLLTQHLTMHPTLTSVDLTANNFTVPSARKLLEWVQNSKGIRELKLDPGTPKYIYLEKQCLANSNVLVDVSLCLHCGKHLITPQDGAEAMFLTRLSEYIATTTKLSFSDFRFLFRVILTAVNLNDGVMVFCSRPCIAQFVCDLVDVIKQPHIEPRNQLQRSVWDGYEFDGPAHVPKPPSRDSHNSGSHTNPRLLSVESSFDGGAQNPSILSRWRRCDFCAREGAAIEDVYRSLILAIPTELTKLGGPRGDPAGGPVLRPSVFVRFVSRMTGLRDTHLCSKRCVRWLLRSGLMGGGGVLTHRSDASDMPLHEDTPEMRLPPEKEDFSLVDLDMPNTRDHGEADMSAAYAVASVCEDVEGVPIDPAFCFAAARNLGNRDVCHWGVELRDVCRAVTQCGVIPSAMSPITPSVPRDSIADWSYWTSLPQYDALLKSAASRRKPHFFSISGPYDNPFDNIRAALWSSRSSNRCVLSACKWRPQWTWAPGGLVVDERYKGGFGMAVKVVGQRFINGETHLIVNPCLGSRRGLRGYFFIPRAVFNHHFRFGAFVFKEKSASLLRDVGTSYMNEGILEKLDVEAREILQAPSLALETLVFLSNPEERQLFYDERDSLASVMRDLPLDALFMYRGNSYEHTSYDTRVLNHIVHAYRGNFRSQIAFFWANQVPHHVTAWFHRLMMAISAVRRRVKNASETLNSEIRKQSVAIRLDPPASPGPASAAVTPQSVQSSSSSKDLSRIPSLPKSGRSSAKSFDSAASGRLRRLNSQRMSRASSGSKVTLRTPNAPVVTFEPPEPEDDDHLSRSLSRRGSMSHWKVTTPTNTKSSMWLESAKEITLSTDRTLLAARYGLPRMVLNRVHPRGEGVSIVIYFTCAGQVIEYDYELSTVVKDPIPMRNHPLFSELPITDGIDCVVYEDVFESSAAYCFAGAVWLKWDGVSGSVLDGPLSMRENPPFVGLPPPFSDHIDAGVNVNSTKTTFLFSGNQFLEYDIKKMSVVTPPQPLGTGAFEELPQPLCLGIQSAILHPKFPHCVFLIRDELVCLYDLDTYSIERDLSDVAAAFPNLPRPFFTHAISDLMNDVSKVLLTQLPSGRHGSVVPISHDINVGFEEKYWKLMPSRNTVELTQLDVHCNGFVGVLRHTSLKAICNLYFDMRELTRTPVGYMQLMTPTPGVFVKVSSSSDGASWSLVSTMRVESYVTHKWWSEAHLKRFWRLTFMGLPTGDNARPFVLHRVLWFEATWIPQHVPYEFMQQCEPHSKWSVSITAPRILAHPSTISRYAASPSEVVAFPSGTRWVPKHCAIPLLFYGNDTCLFAVGDRFVQWNLRENRVVDRSSFPFSVHPRFSGLPMPFSMMGMDCVALLEPQDGREMYLFCDEYVVLWDIDLSAAIGPVERLGQVGTTFERLPHPFRTRIDSALSYEREDAVETLFFHDDLYVVWSISDGDVIEGPYKLEHAMDNLQFPPNMLSYAPRLHAVIQSPDPQTRLFFAGDRWWEQTTSLTGGGGCRGPFAVRTGEKFSRMVRTLGWSTTTMNAVIRFDLGEKPKLFCDVRVFTTVGVDSNARWLVQWSDSGLEWVTVATHVQREGWCRSSWCLEDVGYVSHRYWQLVADNPQEENSVPSNVTYNSVQWGVLPSSALATNVDIYDTNAVIKKNVFESFTFPAAEGTSAPRFVLFDFGVDSMVDLVGFSAQLVGSNQAGLFSWCVMCGTHMSDLEEIACIPVRTHYIEAWWAPTLPKRYWRVELRGKGVTSAELTFEHFRFYEYTGPAAFRSDCALSRKDYIDGISVLANANSRTCIKLTSTRVGTVVELNTKLRPVPFTMLEMHTEQGGNSVTNWAVMASSDRRMWTQLSQLAQSSNRCIAWWLNHGAYQHWRLQCTSQFGGGWPRISRLKWFVGKGELYTNVRMNALAQSQHENEWNFVVALSGQVALVRCIVNAVVSEPTKLNVEYYSTALARWLPATQITLPCQESTHIIQWSYCGAHLSWRLHCPSSEVSHFDVPPDPQSTSWFCLSMLRFVPASSVSPMCGKQTVPFPVSLEENELPYYMRWDLQYPSAFARFVMRRADQSIGVTEWGIFCSLDGETWLRVVTHVQDNPLCSTTFTAFFACKHWAVVSMTPNAHIVEEANLYTPIGVATAKGGDLTRVHADSLRLDEVTMLRDTYDALQHKMLSWMKSEAIPGSEADLAATAQRPAGGALGNPVSAVYPELVGAMLHSIKDIQRSMVRFLKESRSSAAMMGNELHRFVSEKQPRCAWSGLIEIIPSISFKEIKFLKDNASNPSVLPKLDYRGVFFNEFLGMPGLTGVVSLRWPSVPPSFIHASLHVMREEAERVEFVSSRQSTLTSTAHALGLIIVELKDVVEFQPGKSFPNLLGLFSALRVVLKKSMLVVSTGSHWFGNKEPLRPLTAANGSTFDHTYPMCLSRGINVFTRVDLARAQGTPFPYLSVLKFTEPVAMQLAFPSPMAQMATLTFCSTTETNLGVQNMKLQPTYVHMSWHLGVWNSLTFTSSAFWTVQGTPLMFNLRGEIDMKSDVVSFGGRCDNVGLPDVCGLPGLTLTELEATFLCNINLETGDLVLKEAIMSGCIVMNGDSSVYAHVTLTSPTRPRLLCESPRVDMRCLALYLREYCQCEHEIEDWVFALDISLVDCELRFGPSRSITITGWARVFDVEGRATAQLSAAGLHISSKLPECCVGSLWCKPLASTTDNAVGFELQAATSATHSSHVEVFATLCLTSLITCPGVIHITRQGCTSSVEHTPQQFPWMRMQLSMTTDVHFEREFIVSGTLSRQAAETALQAALLSIPVVAEVVSVGLDFAFKLNNITMVPFCLTRPVVCVRFVGVFLGSDFNIVAAVDTENVTTFLPYVASIIVENCSSVVRSVWDEFVGSGAGASNSEHEHSDFLLTSISRMDLMQSLVTLDREASTTGSMNAATVVIPQQPTALNFVHDAFESRM
eukprot:PhM_4_TR1361/c0_g1_i1/m.28931